MPQRIQRKRTPGWRLPEGSVIVDRTSRFGNPFRTQDCIEHGYAETESDARVWCVGDHRDWVSGSAEFSDTYQVGGKTFDRRRVLADLHLLRGKDLACTCPLPDPGQPDHCHGRVLIDLANTPEEN